MVKNQRTAEVQVVEGTGDAADQINAGRQKNGVRGQGCIDQTQVGEDESQGGNGKDLKETFDPQLHNPSAPIRHDRQGRARAVEKARAIKQTNRNRGTGNHQDPHRRQHHPREEEVWSRQAGFAKAKSKGPSGRICRYRGFDPFTESEND